MPGRVKRISPRRLSHRSITDFSRWLAILKSHRRRVPAEHEL